jgi:hypothetical protein
VVIGKHDDLGRVDVELARRAAANGLITARVDSASVRIHMIQNVFFAIARQIDWPTLAQHWMEGKFDETGYTWPRPGEPVPIRELAESNKIAEVLLQKAIREWLTLGIYREVEMASDFRNAIASLCLARTEPYDPASSPPILDWLRGDLRTIGALKDVHIGSRITRNNGRAMLRSLCCWLRMTGQGGLVVRLDLRHLTDPGSGQASGIRYSPSAILDAFEVLRQFIDDSDLFGGLLVVALGAEELIAGDPRRSILAYPALRQRLESDVRSAAHDNPLAPLVNLSQAAPSSLRKEESAVPYSAERVTVEALRAGVPPNGVAARMVGTEEPKLESAFVAGLKQAQGAQLGTATGILVAGDFGAGKSHLLACLSEQARQYDFVVSKITISKETPLFNPERVFAAAIRNATLSNVNDDIMHVVVEKLLAHTDDLQALEAAVSQPESGFSDIFAAVLHVLPKNIVNAEDRAAIARFFGGARLGTPRVRTWLRSAGSIKLFELKNVRIADLVQQRIRLAPLLFRAAGFAGWCLMFDELELIARYSILQRAKSYAELARWLALDPLTAVPHTMAVGAMTLDFPAEVFDRRLDQEKVPAMLGARDMDQAVRQAGRAMAAIERGMHPLSKPDDARLKRSFEEIRWLYQQSYGWRSEAADVGERSAAKPIREYVKSWITGWDIERLYGTRDRIDVRPIASDYAENPDLERPSPVDDDEA